MAELWFWIVGLMLIAWAALDGYDLGAGMLHRFVARTDTQRREVLGAIGPVIDANKVWLVAAGGALYFAFPRLMAAAFSGFYLPMIFVIWALLLRGVSLELRSHVSNALWRSFFDMTFTLASFVVPALMGALLGNVVRGVPLKADGYFELGLFAAEGAPGVFDAYALLCAVFTVVTLAAHGANWLAFKTEGTVQQRVLRLRLPLWIATAVLWLVTMLLTNTQTFPQRPIAWLGAVLALGGVVTVFVKQKEELAPFLGGLAFITGCLVMTAACLFPIALRATVPALSLTVEGAATGARAMSGALLWVGPGLVIAAGYLWWVLRHFRGKVAAAKDGEGY